MGDVKKIQLKKGSAKFIMGAQNATQVKKWTAENPEAIGFAMVGRSNVGKSSLINTFFGAKTARVSKTPGRTREINIFRFEMENMPEGSNPYFYLYDLPGYGFASVSKEMIRNWHSLMDGFFSTANDFTLLLNIQDSRHPHQKSDQDFQDYIRPMELDTYLVFNKIDKLKKQKERAALNKLKPVIFQEYKWVKQIFFVSAEKRTGCDQLHDTLVNFLMDNHNKIQHFHEQNESEEE
jgi:GTP-binding protein